MPSLGETIRESLDDLAEAVVHLLLYSANTLDAVHECLRAGIVVVSDTSSPIDSSLPTT